MTKRFVIGICAVLCLGVQACISTDKCSHVDMEWIKSQAPLPENSQILTKQEREGLCEAIVSMNGRRVPLYAGKTFLITGGMFKDNKSLTRETMEQLAPPTAARIHADGNPRGTVAERMSGRGSRLLASPRRWTDWPDVN